MMLANVTEIESVSFKGYLEKQGRVKTWAWRKYWFVLEDGQLAYFRDETLAEGRGLIDLGQALTIKACPSGGTRDFSLEIAIKNRNHVLCAESEQLRDQWIRLLQQAKLLRPRRTPSMNIARCNSISSDEEGLDSLDISSLDDLGSLDSLATPPLTPKSPRTPNSPKASSSPLFGNKQGKNKTNSPKLLKNNVKCSSSPKFGFMTGPSSKNSEHVMLTSIRPLHPDSSLDHRDGGPGNKKKTEEGVKRRIAATKTCLGVMESKTPVSRMCTSPHDSPLTRNGVYKKSRSESGIKSEAPLPRDSVRPVSSPGQLTRGKPVSKDVRPHIVARTPGLISQTSTSSDESDNSSASSDFSKPKLGRRTSGNQKNTRLMPKQSTGGAVVLRRVVRPTKSLPYTRRKDTDSDSDLDSDPSDNVFVPPPTTSASQRQPEEALTERTIDGCCERLSKSLSLKRPPVADLPFPRLELTFRSAFDDIRLFLANNRSEDEIFPVPRLSERGGKAISKLKKFIDTLT